MHVGSKYCTLHAFLIVCACVCMCECVRLFVRLSVCMHMHLPPCRESTQGKRAESFHTESRSSGRSVDARAQVPLATAWRSGRGRRGGAAEGPRSIGRRAPRQRRRWPFLPRRPLLLDFFFMLFPLLLRPLPSPLPLHLLSCSL